MTNNIKFIDNQFVITFDYDKHLVNAVKELPGRRFDGAKRNWKIPVTSQTIALIQDFASEHNFEISEHTHEAIKTHQEKREKTIAKTIAASKATDANIHVEGLGGKLLPFQRAGVAYLKDHPQTFLADEMGLGKTVQALAGLQIHGAFPAIVVCPASLKLNWKKEAEKWLPGRTVGVVDSGKDEIPKDKDILVINYDILTKQQEKLKEINAKGVVYDESHYCKNYKAKRTIAAKELAKDIPIRFLLTGTPIKSRPQELLSQLQILGWLDKLGGFWNFAKRYCDYKKTKYGADLSGASNTEELNEKLRENGYIRRLKHDVLTELPPKRRIVLNFELSNQSKYEKASKQFLSWLAQEKGKEASEKASRAEHLAKIEHLKQLAVAGKIDAVNEWIEDFLETGEKLVIFAHHTDVTNALAQKFNASKITGAETVEQRQAAVEDFQKNTGKKVIVCNIQAGGVGHTLTAASNVLFVEQAWTPGDMDQAEDRCHRIGQKDSVTAWYALGEKSIDHDIYNLIEAKREIVESVSDGGKITTANQGSIYGDLIKKMGGEPGKEEQIEATPEPEVDLGPPENCWWPPSEHHPWII